MALNKLLFLRCKVLREDIKRAGGSETGGGDGGWHDETLCRQSLTTKDDSKLE